MKELLSKVKSYFKGKDLSENTLPPKSKQKNDNSEEWPSECFEGIYLKYPDLKVPVVNDFVEPRYVYDSLKESVEHNPEFGAVIGYRIANDLVIHDMFIRGYCLRDCLRSFKAEFGVEILDYDKDLPIFLKYFDRINEMRKAIGDVWGDHNKFWVRWNGYTESYDRIDGRLENDPDISTFVGKRINA